MPEDSRESTAWRAGSAAVRERMAEAVATADRVEVCLLDPVKEPGALGHFPLPPYGRQARTGVHRVKTVEGAAAAELLALWTGVLGDDEGLQAQCHYPIHGLRFFCGAAVLAETSVCWLCNNYSAGTEHGPRWLGLPGGYPHGPPTPSCAALRQLLESLMPVPDALVRKVRDGGARAGQRRGGYGGEAGGRKS